MEIAKPLLSFMHIENWEMSLLKLVSLINEIELKLRGLDLTIFSEVTAKISVMAIQNIPKEATHFFESVPNKTKFDEEQCTVTGSLASIVTAYAQILKLFKESNRESVPCGNINKTSEKISTCEVQTIQSLKHGLKNKTIMDSETNNLQENEEYINVATKKGKGDQADCLAQFKHFCKLCSFKTKRISHLQKHMAIHKKVKTLFQCHLCSFTTVRSGHLKRHKMHHSNHIYKCEKCAYETDEAKLLSKHIKVKHESKTLQTSETHQILECDQCQYKCKNRHLLERHVRVHGVQSHQCELCRYRTRRKEHYIRHVNNVHKNKRPFLCHFCGKAFKRGDALRQHQITHEGEGEMEGEGAAPPYPCQHCDKGFRSHSHFLEHTAVHSNDRAFLCEICGASFKTRSVQRKHVQSIHKNPRAHVCSFCERRFNTQYALKRHCKVHEISNDDQTTPKLTPEKSCVDSDAISLSDTQVITQDPLVPTNVSVLTLTPENELINDQLTFNSSPSELVTSTFVEVEGATLLYLTNIP